MFFCKLTCTFTHNNTHHFSDIFKVYTQKKILKNFKIVAFCLQSFIKNTKIKCFWNFHMVSLNSGAKGLPHTVHLILV